METGRPTKYKEEYNKQAYKLCLLGHTDAELAEYFEICEATLNNWKLEYPDFLESIKSGKQIADADVTESLYKRAIGYSHPDVDIKCYEGEIIETEITKHYPPDPTSMIFWLKNRQPKMWRDKQEIDHSNKGEAFTESSSMTLKEKLILKYGAKSQEVADYLESNPE